MSNERKGYLVLGIVLAVAVVYGLLSFQQSKNSTEPSPSTEVGVGETALPSQDLDTILDQLPTTERADFDPESIEWVNYTDGQDRFYVQRPAGWEVSDTVHAKKTENRRIFISEGIAGFAVYPKGEFDFGLPFTAPMETALTLSDRPATMREWFLPDGSWLAVVTLDSQPKNGFRIELTVLQVNDVPRQVLKEMLNRFWFLDDLDL